MSVQLEIADGNPWWLSFDIWTVPGEDPDAPEGPATVGTPCYVWARVRNTGTSRIENATVRFYWANPNVGFNRQTATPIGTAYVSLNGGGDTQNVLCLTPWVPAFVNGGHECLLVEAFHPSLDPLPLTPEFNAATDRHVAQRNLTVLTAQGDSMFRIPFEVRNPTAREQAYALSVRLADEDQISRVAKNLRRRDLTRSSGKDTRLGLSIEHTPNWCATASKGEPHLERVLVPAGGSVGVLLVGKVGAKPSLVHVVQQLGDKEVGGTSFLLLPNAEKSDHDRARNT